MFSVSTFLGGGIPLAGHTWGGGGAKRTLVLTSFRSGTPWKKQSDLTSTSFLNFYEASPGGNIWKTCTQFLTTNLKIQARSFRRTVLMRLFESWRQVRTWRSKYGIPFFTSGSLLPHINKQTVLIEKKCTELIYFKSNVVTALSIYTPIQQVIELILQFWSINKCASYVSLFLELILLTPLVCWGNFNICCSHDFSANLS